ncbi:MAG: hypothetical protein HGA94_02445, partial [Candidatus Aminicenantes bacterium]|nr:hypothetical protein [Candidatus Aminicenantes bacterium]
MRDLEPDGRLPGDAQGFGHGLEKAGLLVPHMRGVEAARKGRDPAERDELLGCDRRADLDADGIDNAPVLAHMAGDMKSIGRSTTLPEDISDIEKAKLVLMELADDIGTTARRHNKKGRTVHITLKYSDFRVVTRQTTIHATCTTKEIYQAGCSLLEQNW